MNELFSGHWKVKYVNKDSKQQIAILANKRILNNIYLLL